MDSECINPIITNTKKIIHERGIKQKVVAEKAGYTAQQFSNMLNERKIIECGDVLRISAALDVTPNDLFGITSSNQKGA